VVGRFRTPVSAVLPYALMFVVLALFGVVGWLIPVAGSAVLLLIRSRQGLTVTAAGVAATNLGTRFIAWESIRGFRAESFWRGGIMIDTDTGSVFGFAPCSWWGGPPGPDALRQLEALRPSDRLEHPAPG
jgi:hypothetical protein